MPLIYSFIAREPATVLAEYTSYHGNFKTVALECLEHLQPGAGHTMQHARSRMQRALCSCQLRHGACAVLASSAA